jgi:tetratricopeptide (TPR) repeat protein
MHYPEFLWKVVAGVSVGALLFVGVRKLRGLLNIHSSPDSGNDLSRLTDQNLFDDAAQLEKPYLILSDHPNAPADTKTAQADLFRVVALLREVVRRTPRHHKAWWILGKSYQALGQKPESYECFRRAFAENPSSVQAGRELTLSCLAVGKGEEAVAAARVTSSLDPGDFGLLANLGLALLVAGDLDEALKISREALAKQPDDIKTRKLLSWIEEVMAGKAPRPDRYPSD